MKLPLNQALNLLDAGTRRKLPLILASFALVALMDAIGISLVFPLMVSLVEPASLKQVPFIHDSFATFGLSEPKSIVLVLSAAVAGLFLAKNILTIVLFRWQYKVLFAAEAKLGTDLLNRYLTIPWSTVAGRNSSELIRNASVSTSHLFLSFLVPAITITVESLLALAVILLLLFIDAQVAILATLLVGVAGGGYYWLIRKRLHSIGSDFQQANFEVLNHLKQGIGAGREIRILGREDEFVRQLKISRDLYARSQAARSVLTHVPRYYLESVLILVVICIIYVTTATRPLAEIAPLLAVFAVASLRLMNSASRILSSAQQVKIGVPAVLAVAEEYALLQNLSTKDSIRKTLSPKGSKGLSLNALSFNYNKEPVFSDISLTINWGSCIGIIGPSGSGKSTLFDILIGLIRPTQGTVFADGENIHENPQNWRKRIGYVPQSVYLSDDTLRRNVAFGLADEAIDDNKIQKALRMAQLDSFVATLPDGLDTRIGEHGATLSGGQKQRIGIARALYHDPDILFMDEATSALDGETEKQIVQTIDSLRGTKTIIVIAHRLSTLEPCDHIYRLEKGTLSEVTQARGDSEKQVAG